MLCLYVYVQDSFLALIQEPATIVCPIERNFELVFLDPKFKISDYKLPLHSNTYACISIIFYMMSLKCPVILQSLAQFVFTKVCHLMQFHYSSYCRLIGISGLTVSKIIIIIIIIIGIYVLDAYVTSNSMVTSTHAGRHSCTCIIRCSYPRSATDMYSVHTKLEAR